MIFHNIGIIASVFQAAPELRFSTAQPTVLRDKTWTCEAFFFVCLILNFSIKIFLFKGNTQVLQTTLPLSTKQINSPPFLFSVATAHHDV